MKSKLYIVVAIFLLIICIFIFKSNKLKEYEKNLFYMDTYIEVKIYTDNKKKAEEIFNNIEKIYSKYHKITNVYDENSEVYKINNTKQEIITISEELYDILELSIKYEEVSKNKFNINMASITKLWNDYREKKNGIPSFDELKNTYIDSKIILLDDNMIQSKNFNIDLGAVSKGYATYKVDEYLKSIGIKNYLINAGGNVVVGESYDKEYFNIGIENPTKNNDIYKIVKGNNISVVTSGGYERFYEYDGIKYHHIIDPETLYPANNVLSVTVIAKNSAVADIMSTILFLLPIEDSLNLVNSLDDVEAIFYVDENNIIKSDGFYKYE